MDAITNAESKAATWFVRGTVTLTIAAAAFFGGRHFGSNAVPPAPDAGPVRAAPQNKPSVVDVGCEFTMTDAGVPTLSFAPWKCPPNYEPQAPAIDYSCPGNEHPYREQKCLCVPRIAVPPQ